MDIYICTGSYHVFVTQLLKMLDNKECSGTLCIVERFESAKLMCERIIKAGFFERVILIDERTYKELEQRAINKSQMVRKIIRRWIRRADCRKYKSLGFFHEKYKRIFVPGSTFAFNDFVLYQHINYRTQVYLIDDGLGQRMGCQIIPTRKEILLDYGRRYQFFKIVFGKYYFSPDMTIATYPFCEIIKQCRPIKEDVEKYGINYKSFLEQIRKIYTYKIDGFEHLDALYLAGGYDICESLKQYSERDIEVAEHCFQIVESCAVKKHPGSCEKYTSNITEFDTDLPLEVIFMYNDLENKILISSASAAVFNPKFIFNKEPYIILTYRLFEDELAMKMFGCCGKKLDSLVKRVLIDKYKNPQKVYIPKTIEELDKQLKKIINQIKGEMQNEVL